MRLTAEEAEAVLWHLADNAARHGATRLDVSARQVGHVLQVMVRDNGAGLPDTDRHRIFDPFFTIRRGEGGTGMGLPIVRAMLLAHDGKIESADADTGAAFALEVPLATPAPADPRLARRPVLARLSAVAAVIASGLALRLFGPGLGLPFGVTKYGGSVLWGAMAYGFVAAAWRSAGPVRAAGVAMALAAAVEASRLIHSPTLDAFRLTTEGALLLGRVFSGWNVLSYAAGILAWAGADLASAKREEHLM